MKKEQEPVVEEENNDEFQINTGLIFTDVHENWKNYDRKFLKEIFQNALLIILQAKKIFSEIYDDASKSYFEHYSNVRYPKEREEANDITKFPFPNYFMRYHGPTDPIPSIIDFAENCIVERGSYYFDLFFALKLSTVDIMKTDDFLEYHLKESFGDNFNEFKLFLENILIKYKDFLQDKHEIVVNRFIKQKEKQAITDIKIEEGRNKESTLRRQVMAIKYLLDEIGVSQIDNTEIARFAEFLTGRLSKSSNIKNTSIYKMIPKPLNKSDKATREDLQYVRNYFEKLNIASILKRINEEIAVTG
jgi:hypothetical protein